MPKARITITVDPHLAEYAERLVESGRAPSVSAAFNDAFAERVQRDRRARRWWAVKSAEAAADPDTADRVGWNAHVAGIANVAVCPILTLDPARWRSASGAMAEPLDIIGISDPAGV